MYLIKIAIFIFIEIVSGTSAKAALNNLELVLVQAIWRHGDRTPQSNFNSDYIKPKDWARIAGIESGQSPFGVITPKGVQQHFQLGREIRKRYVEETFNFLPRDKDEASEMILVRSTNLNRTIISAMSNVYGMYSDNKEVPKDFDMKSYSKNIPIFVDITPNVENDCTSNIQCSCPRRSKLQRMAHELDEFKKFVNSKEFVELSSNLTKWTGQTITADNFWQLVDSLHCERIHFMDQLVSKNKWYSENLYNEMKKLNHRFNKFTSGIYDEKKEENFDVGHEIRRIRVGPITNEIYNRIVEKMECVKNPRCVNSLAQNLRYYAYSAHDMTIYSLLTAFGIESHVGEDDGEWPSYAASVFVELFVDKAKNPYFRIVYKANASAPFENLTKFIPSCDGQDICPLQVFDKTAKLYSLGENGGDINTLCQQIPSSSSISDPREKANRLNVYSSSTPLQLPVLFLCAIIFLTNGF